MLRFLPEEIDYGPQVVPGLARLRVAFRRRLAQASMWDVFGLDFWTWLAPFGVCSPPIYLLRLELPGRRSSTGGASAPPDPLGA